MADSQRPKKAVMDATRDPVKSWTGWDEWTADNAFGWVRSIDGL